MTAILTFTEIRYTYFVNLEPVLYIRLSGVVLTLVLLSRHEERKAPLDMILLATEQGQNGNEFN